MMQVRRFSSLSLWRFLLFTEKAQKREKGPKWQKRQKRQNRHFCQKSTKMAFIGLQHQKRTSMSVIFHDPMIINDYIQHGIYDEYESGGWVTTNKVTYTTSLSHKSVNLDVFQPGVKNVKKALFCQKRRKCRKWPKRHFYQKSTIVQKRPLAEIKWCK